VFQGPKLTIFTKDLQVANDSGWAIAARWTCSLGACVSACATLPTTRKSKSAEHPALLADESQPHYTTLRQRTIGSFTLSERRYSSSLAQSNQVHPEACITFVIEGCMRESSSFGTMVCRAGAVRFLPAGEVHESQIESQLRCLEITNDSGVFDHLDRPSVVPQKPVQINGLTTTWLANRLYAEFCRQDDASAMAIEGLILEIFAEIARTEARPETLVLPLWLKHATDIVESRFLERLSLADIASEVGVHYVHLSRQFHKYNRCTIGELIRKRRVQHASHLLAHSRTPLAEIALICGFSDQSHLSFLFKRYMGLSPSRFRSLAGKEPSPAAPIPALQPSYATAK
jgi:AraC family transcriptional regulator